MPDGRALRLLLRWSVAVAAVLVALRYLWGAWSLDPGEYWRIVRLTFVVIGGLVLTAAVPGALLVLARRALGGRRPDGPPGRRGEDVRNPGPEGSGRDR